MAFDKLAGDVRWSYDIRQDGDQSYFHGDFHLTDELVLTASDGQGFGTVYAFERKTGSVRWSHTEQENIPSTVVPGGESVYVVTQPDQVLALDLASGDLRWNFRTQGDRIGRTRLVSSPVVDDELVYVSGRDGILYALDAATGVVEWRVDFQTPAITSPAMWRGGLYVGTGAGRIVRVDAATGTVEAEAEIGSSLYVEYGLSASDDGVFVYSGIAPGTSAPAELNVFATSLTEVRWRHDNERGWSTPRAYSWGEYIVAGDVAGNIYLFRHSDGSVARSFRIDGEPRGIGGEGHMLYIGTLNGMLYAYEMENGGN